MTTRRTFLKVATALSLTPSLASAQGAGRVVVIGGGFAGATCARTLKKLEPKLTVTLVEPNKTFIACPFSNGVIAGLRELSQQQFGYDGVVRDGVVLAQTTATGVDTSARTVTLADGQRLSYDRLVMAPGIDLNWAGLPGYTEDAAEKMPHAWKAGPQTLLLRRQLEAMDDGGLVVMAIPANPFRCPPGPYERASLIAHYLKTKKPKSKLLLLDAKDVFSKQRLFQNAWTQLYPGLVEWVALGQGGKVTSVDPSTLTLATDFDKHKAAVANVIPPQKAGAIAATAGVADRTGWCPVEPMAFESTLQPGIHVLGDAALMGAMPKSAFSANAQAYDTLTSFESVGRVGDLPLVLVVHPSLQVKTLAELVAFAKANPDKLTHSSSGNSTVSHVAMEALKAAAGIRIVHVPYQGSAPAMNDLIAGNVMVAMDTVAVTRPHIEAGRLRLIATGSLDRLPFFPDMPTISEQGFPGFEANAWLGMLLPARTPRETVERLSAALQKIVRLPDTEKKFSSVGTLPKTSTSAEFDTFLRAEYARWGKAIAQSGVKAD